MTDGTNGQDILSLDLVATVRERYERWLPERLAEIPESERDSFYSTLADQITERVQSLELSLRGRGPEDETFMARVGRFNTARLQAKEIALTELLPVPDYEKEFQAEDRLLMVTDLDIVAEHDLDPEDPDYEPKLEGWRQYHRERGNYLPSDS